MSVKSNQIIKEIQKYTENESDIIIKKIKDNIDSNLKNFAESVVYKLRSYTLQWYNSYEPLDYYRSMDLVNSITYNINNYKINVKFDMRRFHTKKINNGVGWQQHRGFDDMIYTWGLVDFIENGGNGGISTNPRKYDGGIHMIENTKKWLNDYLEKEVNNIIKVTIRDYYKR